MTEEEEIKAAIKARLKAEGIDTEDEKPAPEVRRGHAKPPAHLPSGESAPSAENKPSPEQGGEQKSVADQVLEALEKAQRQQKEEDKKKEEAQTLSNKQIAAGTGAAAGVVARLSGRDIESGFKPSPEGTNIFSPRPTEENIRVMNEAVGDIKERQSLVKDIETKLRNLTQDPNAKITDFTPDQVQRILSGGEGPTLGTTGAQRSYGLNEEQQRISRHLQETERNVRAFNPNLPDPIVAAGQMVPLPGSNIRIPSNVASGMAQEQAKAQTEQQRKNLELQRQSELNKAGLAQETINKEANLAKSRGYRSGLGKTVMGGIGGAQSGLSALDIYQKWKNGEPLDWQDWSRLGGSLAQTFGGPKTGIAGGLATLPWAIKHKEELLRGMSQSDVNPTAMPAGTALGDEPLYRDPQAGR